MKLAGMLILNFSIVNVSCTPAWAYFTSEGSKQIWHGFLPHFWGWWAQSSLFPFIYAPQIQPLSVAVISAVTKVWSLTGFPPVNTASLQLDWSQGSSPFLSLSLQITSAATRKLFDRFPLRTLPAVLIWQVTLTSTTDPAVLGEFFVICWCSITECQGNTQYHFLYNLQRFSILLHSRATITHKISST